MTNWTSRYMALASMVASWSKDPSTKVGAVLVGKDRRQVALGYNGFPPGIDDSEARLNDRKVKHLLTQHAERNVLDNAHFDCRGATLITTRYPCHECAKSLVSKGIAKVITPVKPTDPLWAESSDAAQIVMEEGGVQIEFFRADPTGFELVHKGWIETAQDALRNIQQMVQNKSAINQEASVALVALEARGDPHEKI